MTPRPFHRWKSFWLGILVLVFLGWWWIHSTGREEYFSWSRPPSGIALAHVEGECAVLLYQQGVPFPPGFHMTKQAPGERNVPTSPFSFQNYKGRAFYLHVAHWFLLLVFLLPWITFLVWRHRQMKRLAAEARDPQP